MPTSRLGQPTNPADGAQLPHAGARPRLGLRRRARSAQQELYDPADHVKLKVESGGLFEDLPRRADGTAIIGDPRNDENLIIAGLHAPSCSSTTARSTTSAARGA